MKLAQLKIQKEIVQFSASLSVYDDRCGVTLSADHGDDLIGCCVSFVCVRLFYRSLLFFIIYFCMHALITVRSTDLEIK